MKPDWVIRSTTAPNCRIASREDAAKCPEFSSAWDGRVAREKYTADMAWSVDAN